MHISKTKIIQLVITEVAALDPVRVMIENVRPGAGSITITCFGKSWTSYWGSMGGGTVEQFFIDCNDSYLVNCLDRGISSVIEGEDNDANIEFVKKAILKLRRDGEIKAAEAREYWDEAESSDDVKDKCCSWNNHSNLRKVFGDDPWYAGWPTLPNPKYEYLKRIVQAVRAALIEISAMEKAS